MKIDLKVYVNYDGTSYKRGKNDVLKPIFRLSNLIYKFQLVCPFSTEDVLQVIFEKADNSVTNYYNMSLVGTEQVGEELWNVYEFELPSEVTEVSSKESNYNKLGFNFYVQKPGEDRITLNTEPYYVTCNYAIVGEQIQYNAIEVNDLLMTINSTLSSRDKTKIFKVNNLPFQNDEKLQGNAYLLTGEYQELNQFNNVESLDTNKVYKYTGETTSELTQGKFYVRNVGFNELQETIDVEKNKGNIYLLINKEYLLISYGKENIDSIDSRVGKSENDITDLYGRLNEFFDQEYYPTKEEDKVNAKVYSIRHQEVIEEEMLSSLIKFGNKAFIKYAEPPYSSICTFLYEEEKTMYYRGVVVSTNKELLTLTIEINKENGSVKYTFDNNLLTVEESIKTLKNNVQKLLDGSASIQAGGWVKIDGVLKAEEVTALYQTKGTGLYTITSEEFGKEAVIIDTSKQLFKRQTGKYDYIYNFNTNQWEVLASGTGGGTGGGTAGAVILTNTTPLEAIVAVGTTYKIGYEFSSTQDTKGTAQYYVDGTLRRTVVVNTGSVEFDVSDYITSNERVIKVVVTDRFGNTNSLTYILKGIEIELESLFDDSIARSGTFTFSYIPWGLVDKEVIVYLDGEEYKKETISISGESQSIEFKNLTHGVHKLRVTMSAKVNEETIYSNELNYNIIYYVEGNPQILISSKFDVEEATQGELLSIDYIVYNPLAEFTSVNLKVNEEVVNTLSVGRTKQYWNITNYPSGYVTFTILAGEGLEGENSLSYEVKVNEAQISVTPVSSGLQLFLTAEGRSNTEELAKRNTWEYQVNEDTTISATLTDFTWGKNDGWLTENGQSFLRVKGKSKVFIPFNMFKTEVSGDSSETVIDTGKTIEIDFSTRNVYDITKLLVSCFEGDKGFKITSNECLLKSNTVELTTKFKENERIRIGFVIQSKETVSSVEGQSGKIRLVKTFINGVMSGLKQYAAEGESFENNATGISINDYEGDIDIYSIRVYKGALTDKQMLDNYMADLSLGEKISAYTRNNIVDTRGQVNYNDVKKLIPTLIITGELPKAKGDKKNVKVSFENPFDSSKNFLYLDVVIDVQGTSSQKYFRKNYKMKFPVKFSFVENAVEENTYTFKADYMESSHSHNTGNAKLVNKISPKFPTQEGNTNVRNAIDGFPVVIFQRDTDDGNLTYYGVFNFNNDKGNSDTLGLTTPYAESWEFKNSTSGRCLFDLDNFDGDFYNQSEIAISDDFEARYPKDYTNYENIASVVQWVYSTKGNIAKFKEEFEEHFNKDFCLFYYVMMDVMLAVDSRAKNMFLDTLDRTHWYPRWYDIDTTYGLNNTGNLIFGYGLEQHDKIGTTSVFNGDQSILWNNFEEAYASEIQETYNTLRTSGKISYEAIIKALKEEQIDKISERMYNTDGNVKYVAPFIIPNADGVTSNEGEIPAQGNRLEYLKWWVNNHIKYLDSKSHYATYDEDKIELRMTRPQNEDGSLIENLAVEFDGAFNLVPYIDMYCEIKYGSSTEKERAKANEDVLLAPSSALTFKNTEVWLYGASNLLELGDLSNKYAEEMKLANANKVKELKIGSAVKGYENNLYLLTLGELPLLEKFDIQQCAKLTNAVDLSQCQNIREVYAKGSSITSVILAEGGFLQTLELPKTITSLSLVNKPYLTKFAVGDLAFDTNGDVIETSNNFSNIKALRLEKVNVDSLAIIKGMAQIQNVRLIDIDWRLTNAEQSILDSLMSAKGINESGELTAGKAVITGKIHIAGLVSDRRIKAWNKYFNNQETLTPTNPNVAISVDEIGVTHDVRFLDYQGNVLEEKIVPDGTTTTYTGETPTKPTDETLREKYTFSGWSPSLSTPITQNTDFVPNFTITKYWIYKFLNGDGSEIYRGYADNGTTVTYNSDVVPTKAEDFELQREYVFNGSWTPSLDRAIEEDTTYTPDFTRKQYYYVTFQNYDGTQLQMVKVYQGGTAEYTGETPTKPDEDGFAFTFTGWDTTLTNVQSNLIVTAIYKSEKPLSITLNLTNESELQPSLYIQIPETKNSNGSVVYPNWLLEINWGDGNIEELSTGSRYSQTYTKLNPYNSIGTYKITIKINDNGLPLLENLSTNVSSDFNEFGEYNNQAFIGINEGTYTQYITDYYIPEGIFYHLYAENAFNNSKISSFKIPEGIISIDFEGKSSAGFQNIQEVYWPKTLKYSTGRYLFYKKKNTNDITKFYYNGSLQDYLNIKINNQVGNSVFYLNNVDFYLKVNENYELKNEIIIDNKITTLYTNSAQFAEFEKNIYIENFSLPYGSDFFTSMKGVIYLDLSYDKIFNYQSFFEDKMKSKDYYLKVNDVYTNKNNITNINIPESVTYIHEYAFYNWGLTSINVPENIQEIGGAAFYNCSNLISITFENSKNITRIGISCFVSTSLTTFEIPTGMSTLEGPFLSKTKIENLFIPENITTINNYGLSVAASSSDPKVTYTFESETPPSLQGFIVSQKKFINEIRVPSSAVETYKTATNWTQYADLIVGY